MKHDFELKIKEHMILLFQELRECWTDFTFSLKPVSQEVLKHQQTIGKDIIDI